MHNGERMTTISKRIRNGIMEGWSSDAHCLDGEIAKEAADTIDALVAAIERALIWVRPIAGDNTDIAAAVEEENSIAAIDAAIAKAKGKQE